MFCNRSRVNSGKHRKIVFAMRKLHVQIYSDYGWMEYNDGEWYIETRPGSWMKYADDSGTLWYIAE